MVRGVLDALRGETPARRSDTIFDREVVGRERPRPEERPTEETARRPQPPPPPPAPPRDDERRRLVAALSSRAGLRQAVLLQEILGSPRALRRPR